MGRYLFICPLLFLITSVSMNDNKPKPTVYIIGDSTVKKGTSKGEGGLWGWGDFLYKQFDTTKISIKNYALGGRSSRTFFSEGLWDKVLSKLNSGDYVIMQFGHNDNSAVNDSLRARGTLKGIGNETEEIDNILTKKHEIVHTFGWYIQKYISDSKAKGAIPVVCSLVPRNNWENGKVIRSSGNYAKWAKESAKKEKAFYIDLNQIIAEKYDALGEVTVSATFFLTDRTHTTEAGADLNATSVAEGIKSLKGCKLKNYLRKTP
jgi:rhamnogalacturonan acetylesterase